MVPRRTGLHVVSTMTSHLRIPLRGMVVGVRQCNGADNTALPLYL